MFFTPVLEAGVLSNYLPSTVILRIDASLNMKVNTAYVSNSTISLTSNGTLYANSFISQTGVCKISNQNITANSFN